MAIIIAGIEVSGGDGTTQPTFQLDNENNGPLIQHAGSGIVEFRNYLDTLYVPIRAASPVGTNDVVTKGYAETYFQGANANLTALAGLSTSDGNFIVGSPTGWVVETGNTVLTSIGITATLTELNYVDGVTSDIQSQINGKIGASGVTYENLDTNGDVGTSASTVAAGNDSRFPTSDQKAALAGMGTPSSTNKFITNDYLKSALNGLDWQESVLDRYDPTSGLPTATLGVRYISTATANGWTLDYIYEGNGSTFDEIIPDEGTATWVEDEDMNYLYDGTQWIIHSSTSNHNNLTSLQGGTTNEYYHFTSSEHTELTDITSLTHSDGGFLVSNGTTWVIESGSTARTSLGLGTIATQNANGVTITGGTINGTTIGASSASTGVFTTLTVNTTADFSAADTKLKLSAPSSPANGDIWIDGNLIKFKTSTGTYQAGQTRKHHDITTNTTIDNTYESMSFTTGAVNDIVITLPDASTVLGHEYEFFFEVDGGKDVLINCVGADTFNLGNTQIKMNSANDYAKISAVGNDRWIVVIGTGILLS